MKALQLSFGTRIYLLVAMLIVGIMASAASYFLVTQNQALNSALGQQARSLSESLVEGVRIGVLLEDPEFVKQVASGIVGLPNMLYIDVYLDDGTLLQQLGEHDHQLKLSDAIFKMAANSGYFIENGLQNRAQVGNKDFLAPVFTEEGSSEVAGFVRLGLSTAAITKKWQETLVMTIWATLLLVIGGCLLIYLPVRRIIRPIEKLSEGALRIGMGDLEFRISVSRKDEIGLLADNFNIMATSLRKQGGEIQKKTFALERSERKFRELFENIAQPLYINTLDGELIDCNQAMVDLFGFESREEMVQEVQGGEQIFADPKQRDEVTAELLANGEIKELEVDFKRQDGLILKALVTSRVRFDDEGEAVGFEGIIQDVTQMRSLEEQLFHAQKMESIGTLAGGVAHDFNNLLTVILSSAEMARYKIDDHERVERYINSITTASKRASELTKNLLGFARKGKMRVEEVNAGALVTEVEALLRETIDRSIRIYTDISPGLRPIMANPSQIHQVLVNLCVNAKDAILEVGGQELKISVRNVVITQDFADLHPGAVCGPYIEIDVIDDGGGIPKHVRDKIFDPFFTTKGVGQGTGLGLATVYGIIKNHDGFLYLDSEMGKGTAFHIYLPSVPEYEAVKPEAIVKSPEKIFPLVSATNTNATILFVDDEESLRFIASEFLEDNGYQVLLAEDGKQALEMFAEYGNQINLVIVDLMMPEIGGEEVLKAVKQERPDIPVIIVSGYSKMSLNKTMHYQNYDGYIEKPYDMEQFIQLVESSLA